VLERHAAVAKAARRAKKSGVVADFHRLRIRCKRLRYALEFGSEVYEGRTAPYVRQLTALQDELGLMQDAEVAWTRLADLATGATHLPPATVFVMGGMAERHRRDVGRFLRRLPTHVKRVNGRAWRDLLAVMARRKNEAEAVRPLMRSTLRPVPASTGPVETDESAGSLAAPSASSVSTVAPLSPVAPASSPQPARPAALTAPPGPVSPDHPAASPGLSAVPPPPSRQGE
jgi:CHAD domain